MLESHKIFLQDRIKETSYTMGTSSFVLNGAANGFSSFGSVYDNGDNVFYAATDGTFYEIGSGVYITGVQNSLARFPFRSSNNNSIVNFGEGLKEIFVTYPATHSVYSASGLQGNTPPKQSGIAYWSSSNILNYDSNLIWDDVNNRIGIRNISPVHAIDIGGSASESTIKTSGVYIGSVGIVFPPANNGDSLYAGGQQLAHYEPNALNSLTGSDQVLELSGVAKNNILFKKQNAGLVFAGPASGCTPPCSPNYPTFRPMLLEDIHDIDATLDGELLYIHHKLGINTSRVDSNVTSFTNSFNPTTASGWLRGSYLASGLYGGGIALSNSASGYALFTSSSGNTLNIGVGHNSGILSTIASLDANNVSGVKGSVFDFYGQKLRVRNSFTPSTATSPGNSGDMCWDNSYIYVCVAPNTWKRTYLSSWT